MVQDSSSGSFLSLSCFFCFFSAVLCSVLFHHFHDAKKKHALFFGRHGSHRTTRYVFVLCCVLAFLVLFCFVFSLLLPFSCVFSYGFTRFLRGLRLWGSPFSSCVGVLFCLGLFLVALIESKKCSFRRSFRQIRLALCRFVDRKNSFRPTGCVSYACVFCAFSLRRYILLSR